MKKLLCLIPIIALAALGAVKNTARLDWDYPVGEAVTFNVYQSTNAAGPFAVLTNVATTNVIVAITEGSHFYYVTATNEWGESDPSNTVLATVPRRGNNLRITAQ